MISSRFIRSTVSAARIISSRAASGSSQLESHNRTAGIDLENFDPNNYSIPIRRTTMDDLLEPYGPWKQAYEAERKAGNRAIVKGVLCLTASLMFLFNCGAIEGLDMPNLDNILEDTEPFNFDTEGRVSVTRDD